MDHCFYCVSIQLINKNCIIVMNIRLNAVINFIAKKEGLVGKIDFDKHPYKDTRYKAQGTRVTESNTFLNLVPCALCLDPCALFLNFAA